jgi:hypothetical protein
MELEIQPVRATSSAGKAGAEQDNRPGLERGVSVASDGRKRSKFQMACIITALFVREVLSSAVA